MTLGRFRCPSSFPYLMTCQMKILYGSINCVTCQWQQLSAPDSDTHSVVTRRTIFLDQFASLKKIMSRKKIAINFFSKYISRISSERAFVTYYEKTDHLIILFTN